MLPVVQRLPAAARAEVDGGMEGVVPAVGVGGQRERSWRWEMPSVGSGQKVHAGHSTVER
jgi:hypothetical protein